MDRYSEEERLLDEKDLGNLRPSNWHKVQRIQPWKSIFFALLPLLVLSAIMNLVQFQQLRRAMAEISQAGTSPYAGLKFDVETVYETERDSSDHPDLHWDYLWPDKGVVAIDDDEATRLGIPIAQRFPWDEDKGVYFLGVYHSLHCLQNIATALFELRDGKPQTFSETHTLHCLRSVKQDIECYADDTPRYTSEAYVGHSGTDQKRMCRDFSKLNAWAQERTACWHYINQGILDSDTLLRYRYCPPGSPYYERIREVFPDGDFEDFNASSAA